MKGETKQKGKTRWYKCVKCGKDHPSVTTLLDVIGSPALMGWMAKNGTAKLNILDQVCKEKFKELNPDFDYPAMRLLAEERWKLTENTAFWKSGKESGEDAADYGTMAHAWLESHLNGVRIDLEALPEPSRNAVNAYLAWEKEHKIKVVKTEQTFYGCKLNVAGTADAVLELDGEFTLMDWKTSSNIFSTYPIQLWTYALCDESQHGERLYKQVAVGRFGKDGSSDVRIYKRNEFPTVDDAREIILACGSIFSFNQQWTETFPYQKKTKEVPDATKLAI